MIDDRDRLIIRELERNARLSSRKIALKVGLPISTTHRRVKNLEKIGAIKSYKVMVDYEKIGKPVTVLVLINVSESAPKEGFVPLEKIKESLSRYPEVYEIMNSQGSSWDLVLKTRLGNLREVSPLIEKIRKTKGIEEVSAMIITEEVIL